MAVVDLEPGISVPEHQHENEQVGVVLEGTVTMTVAGESRELGPGETYVIPSNALHRAAAGPDGCSVVDIFAPVRADWEKLERQDPTPGRWPK
jgi:quercetin dioxygenase-like cupin family protein